MTAKNNEEEILLTVKRAIHDLNNIFTSNLVSIEQLQKLSSKNEAIQSLLTTLSNNSIRAIDIVNSLTPNSKNLKRRISLSNIITEVTSTVKTTLPKKIKLKVNVENDLPKIEGYFTDLYRVFLNLIINAGESIVDSGLIEVTLTNDIENDSVKISISDNGKGIDEDSISSIFDDGFSSKQKGRESGHGLAIVKKIIEEHNGSISVSSKLNIGTEFCVLLPALYQPQRDVSNKEKRILLIDDDKTILELFSDLLISYNYKIDTAHSATEAYKVFRDDFDLIIVDKVMPDIDGLEFIKKVRSENHTIPIILTTGSHETLEQDLSHLGINKKIKKPYNFEEILSEIEKILI